jgi:hypothetical protein
VRTHHAGAVYRCERSMLAQSAGEDTKLQHCRQVNIQYATTIYRQG